MARFGGPEAGRMVLLGIRRAAYELASAASLAIFAGDTTTAAELMAVLELLSPASRRLSDRPGTEIQ